MKIGVRAKGQGEKCPYCHEQLEAEAVSTCDGCETVYHSACWNELGRCALLGCGSEESADSEGSPEKADVSSTERVRSTQRATNRLQQSSSEAESPFGAGGIVFLLLTEFAAAAIAFQHAREQGIRNDGLDGFFEAVGAAFLILPMPLVVIGLWKLAKSSNRRRVLSNGLKAARFWGLFGLSFSIWILFKEAHPNLEILLVPGCYTFLLGFAAGLLAREKNSI